MKMKSASVFTVLALLALSTINGQLSTLHAQGTAFTYQGRLNDGVNLANGTYDFRFGIYDALTVGTQQGSLITNSATVVSNGLFTVTLDFGNQFPGANRWLEIAVRTNGSSSFLIISPRQALTPAPYAIYAANAGTAASAGSVAAANLVGTLGLGQLPSTVVTNKASGITLNGTFSGRFNSPNFKVTTVLAQSGPLPLAGAYTASGGTLLVTVSGSGYASSIAGVIGAMVLLDNDPFDAIYVTANSTLSHMAFVSKQLVLTGVASGTHTLGFGNLNFNTTTDSGDNFSITVLELPF